MDLIQVAVTQGECKKGKNDTINNPGGMNTQLFFLIKSQRFI